MLEEDGVVQTYNDGDIVFNEGDKGTEMYIVRSGSVKIFRTRRGKEVQLAILRPEDFFGEMALFGNHPRSASAQAMEKTELLKIDKETFLGFIKEPVVWTVLQEMSNRIRHVDDQLEGLSVDDQLRKEHLENLISSRRWFI